MFAAFRFLGIIFLITGAYFLFEEVTNLHNFPNIFSDDSLIEIVGIVFMTFMGVVSSFSISNTYKK